ncbi:MAG TPA: GNAT family N-acetyltransferase [Verrucomicrobiota bacterium]|nr:GNAT family N-acetyltransferase [Verrucomicrobiota bacterium]HNU51710.1 GNAT family N-acetyltransferase [Verrucomicrobiota bacterium]
MNPEAYGLRRCRPEDRDAAYRVCLETGDSGRDGTHLYRDDPMALGHLYVGPYLEFEPELAFVLEDAEGVCGYVLGALDSAEFYQRFVNEWLPDLQARHPEPRGDRAQWSPTQQLYYEYHHYRVCYPESFRVQYPAHAHIDLMARAQGQGNGVRMMNHLMAELRRRGAPGVHLGLSLVNDRAYRFYQKLGFIELLRRGEPEPDVIYMGRAL